MSTREQALEFITLHATQSDIDRIFAAANDRSRTLSKLRSAAVSEGSTVRLGKIKPKYLNGLTGTVQQLRQTRTRTLADLLLDERSTEEVRYLLPEPIPEDTKRYLMRGVPATTCEVLTSDE